LSVGDKYHYQVTGADLKFFFDVEVTNNGALLGVSVFKVFASSMFLATFWDSQRRLGSRCGQSHFLLMFEPV
jgi:hypothetical protein